MNIVIRRVNARSTEAEIVSFSIPEIGPIVGSNLRPIVAVETESPKSAIIKINPTATDEVSDL